MWRADIVRSCGRHLNWGPMVWIGKLSYSLYIWQQLLCWHSELGWFARFPHNLVGSLLMATLSYYLIEQPFAGLRKRVSWFPNPRLFAKPQPCASTSLKQTDSHSASRTGELSMELLRGGELSEIPSDRPP